GWPAGIHAEAPKVYVVPGTTDRHWLAPEPMKAKGWSLVTRSDPEVTAPSASVGFHRRSTPVRLFQPERSASKAGLLRRFGPFARAGAAAMPASNSTSTPATRLGAAAFV